MNPKNILLLAALGVGAYVLTMRKAQAGTTQTRMPTVWAQSPTRAIASAPTPSPIASALNIFDRLLGQSAATPPFVPSNPDMYAVNPGAGVVQDAYASYGDTYGINGF